MVPEKTSARLIHFAERTTIYSLNEQWNAFLILYELRNFSLTAKRLGVTQSALSKAIKKLEDHFRSPYLTAPNARSDPLPMRKLCTRIFSITF